MPEGTGHASAVTGGDVEVFSRHLQAQGRDWFLIDQRDDQHAHLKFTGPFEGRLVVWDCQFATLNALQAPRNFIEIGPPQASGVPLSVGLSIARIDTPAIEKMIIMIRHYKNLGAGRHEYGESQC
jgi:hypothetical protein